MDWRVGFGFIVDEILHFEQSFANYCGTEFAISLSTASVRLDLAMISLNLEPEDEVICPAINFKASPLAVLGQRASLVFCEIDPRTFNCTLIVTQRTLNDELFRKHEQLSQFI